MCTVWSGSPTTWSTVLGSPLAPRATGNPRLWPGALATLLFAWVTGRALVRGRLQAEGLLPFALGTYTIGIASLIGSGARRPGHRTGARVALHHDVLVVVGVGGAVPRLPVSGASVERRHVVSASRLRRHGSRGRGRPPRGQSAAWASAVRGVAAPAFPREGSADRRDGHADARTAVPSCGVSSWNGAPCCSAGVSRSSGAVRTSRSLEPAAHGRP